MNKEIELLCEKALAAVDFKNTFIEIHTDFLQRLLAVVRAAQEYQDKMDGCTIDGLIANWGPVYRALEALDEK